MSVVNRKNLRVLLPRTGPEEFWNTIFETFAREDSRRWRYLAMLALRENNGWPLEYIAKVFDHKPGHITRCLSKIKEELRTAFSGADPEFEERADASAADPREIEESVEDGG